MRTCGTIQLLLTCASLRRHLQSHPVAVLILQGLHDAWIFNQGGSDEEWEGNFSPVFRKPMVRHFIWFFYYSYSEKYTGKLERMQKMQKRDAWSNTRAEENALLWDTLNIFSLSKKKIERWLVFRAKCLHSRKTLVCKRFFNLSVKFKQEPVFGCWSEMTQAYVYFNKGKLTVAS